MSASVFEPHPFPWTEAEYLALGETDSRIELIDGMLLVSPAPRNAHQIISMMLTRAIFPAVMEAGLVPMEATNVRLATDRIVIPDIVVADASFEASVTEAADVVLICEITSPSNAISDRVTKMQLYAAARIGWYLLVEPDVADPTRITMGLFRLHGDHYVEHASAEPGQTLVSGEPFPIEIATQSLIIKR